MMCPKVLQLNTHILQASTATSLRRGASGLISVYQQVISEFNSAKLFKNGGVFCQSSVFLTQGLESEASLRMYESRDTVRNLA